MNSNPSYSWISWGLLFGGRGDDFRVIDHTEPMKLSTFHDLDLNRLHHLPLDKAADLSG
jgi:hypothetical protein